MIDTVAGSAPKRLVSLAELEPILRQTLEAGGSVRLPVTGTSNLPVLAPDRDLVTLVKAEQPLKKGDLPLYKRDSGQFVLHRVVSVQADGCYCCCGDHQWKKERGIRPDQILGVVSEIRRKNREFSAENPRYRFWIQLWVHLLPCRRPLVRIYHAVERLKRLFSRKHPLTKEI